MSMRLARGHTKGLWDYQYSTLFGEEKKKKKQTHIWMSHLLRDIESLRKLKMLETKVTTGYKHNDNKCQTQLFN